MGNSGLPRCLLARVETVQRLPHLQPGQDRLQGVVLVPHRGSEDRHDGVPDVLVHDARCLSMMMSTMTPK